MPKAKTIKSSPKKKFVGGSLALKQKRGTNQRSYVVRNKVRLNEIVISPLAPVFQSGSSYAFELEKRDNLFFLPPLGYIGGRPEVEKIRSRVVADMTQKEIEKIAAAVERRLTGIFATKNDLLPLAEKQDLVPLATQAGVDQVRADISDLRQLVSAVTQSASAAHPRP